MAGVTNFGVNQMKIDWLMDWGTKVGKNNSNKKTRGHSTNTCQSEGGKGDEKSRPKCHMTFLQVF